MLCYPPPFQGSFINPKPLTAHKHSNYHGSTIFPSLLPPLRLHLESPQVSQPYLLPRLGSAPSTRYLTTATISYHSHDSPTRPRPWASWLSKVGLIKLHVSRDQAASSPHTFPREAFLATPLSAQLNTKDAHPLTPNVLPTFPSQWVNTSKSPICSPFAALTPFTEVSDLSLASLALAYFLPNPLPHTAHMTEWKHDLITWAQLFLLHRLQRESFEHSAAIVSMGGPQHTTSQVLTSVLTHPHHQGMQV